MRTIRSAGMSAGDVAVVCAIFTEHRISEFVRHWERNYRMYEDCLFDVHLYQCFGRTWRNLSPQRHLEKAKKRKALLESMPACMVGEWSLAFAGVKNLDERTRQDIVRKFAETQLEVYDKATTHGWFFWCWKDFGGVEWCMRDCIDKGLLKVPGA